MNKSNMLTDLNGSDTEEENDDEMIGTPSLACASDELPWQADDAGTEAQLSQPIPEWLCSPEELSWGVASQELPQERTPAWLRSDSGSHTIAAGTEELPQLPQLSQASQPTPGWLRSAAKILPGQASQPLSTIASPADDDESPAAAAHRPVPTPSSRPPASRRRLNGTTPHHGNTPGRSPCRLTASELANGPPPRRSDARLPFSPGGTNTCRRAYVPFGAVEAATPSDALSDATNGPRASIVPRMSLAYTPYAPPGSQSDGPPRSSGARSAPRSECETEIDLWCGGTQADCTATQRDEPWRDGNLLAGGTQLDDAPRGAERLAGCSPAQAPPATRTAAGCRLQAAGTPMSVSSTHSRGTREYGHLTPSSPTGGGLPHLTPRAEASSGRAEASSGSECSVTSARQLLRVISQTSPTSAGEKLPSPSFAFH